VRSSYEVTKPELRVQIDRDRAATLGVSVQNISRTLQVLFGGTDLSQIKVGGKEYDVIAQLNRDSRLTPADLDRLYVRNDRGRTGADQQRGALRRRGRPHGHQPLQSLPRLHH
jgi:multidrug efflux pump